MKEEIRRFKKSFKEQHEKYNKVDVIFHEILGGEKASNEANRMVDLDFEKFYGEHYLEIFKNCLRGEEIIAAETKYNIKRINEHLVKIIEEYKQLTDELDAIIFEKEG